MALDRKRKIEEEIEEITNPDRTIALNKMVKVRNEVAEKIEEFRVAPTVDLLSRMTETTDLVLKAAIKSTNLKGTNKGELKKLHNVLAAGTIVLATRADKEMEGEHGKEVALLRIELETAREDAKRMKEKAASNRARFEDCLKKLEKMEEAAFSRKKRKKGSITTLQSDEEVDVVDVEDVTMEEEGVDPSDSAEVTAVPVPEPPVVIPSLEEWPAMRPPIKWVSKRTRLFLLQREEIAWRTRSWSGLTRC